MLCHHACVCAHLGIWQFLFYYSLRILALICLVVDWFHFKIKTRVFFPVEQGWGCFMPWMTVDSGLFWSGRGLWIHPGLETSPVTPSQCCSMRHWVSESVSTFSSPKFGQPSHSRLQSLFYQRRMIRLCLANTQDLWEFFSQRWSKSLFSKILCLCNSLGYPLVYGTRKTPVWMT